MSIIKSFSVCDDNGEAGDMFYIKHNSSNFTIIDCCLNCEDRESIVSEIIDEKRNKNIIRVISTHPDEDHICGLDFLDDRIGIVNFYCVENKASKESESESFNLYGTKGIALVVYLLIIVREITLHGTIDIKNIFLNPYPDYVVLILMTLYAVTFVLFVNKQTVIIKAFDYAKSLIEVCERI